MAKKSRYLAYANGVQRNKRNEKPLTKGHDAKGGSVMQRLSMMKDKAKTLDAENRKKKKEDK